MVIDRAYVVLPVLAAEVAELEVCLEHLVAAADEAAASGLPTTVLLATAPGDAVTTVLASWRPLVSLVDGVDVGRVAVPAGASEQEAVDRGSAEVLRRGAPPATTLLLTTRTGIAVGPEWVVEHARHHRGGASATTGPVRGGATSHPVTANLALRLDAWSAGGVRRPSPPLVHAVTPVVGPLRISLPMQF